MSDTTLVIIVAAIIALHFIVGFGWLIWKMRKGK
jgi:hypothetical protein